MQGGAKNPAENQTKRSDESHLPHMTPELKIINEALRTSEDRFKAIVYQSNIAIAECNLAGKFIFVNNRFAQLLAYTEAELYHKYMQDILHPDDASRYTDWLANLESNNHAFETDLQYIRAGGEAVWVSQHSSGLQDMQGRFSSFFTTVTNIDQHKQQEKTGQREEKSTDLLENLTDAFFAVDNNWCFIYVNKKTEELNNRPHGSLLGKNIWSEFPALVNSDYGELYRRVAAQRIAGSIAAVSSVDKQWYEAHAFPVKDGIAAHFKNVTEQKEAEIALQTSEENLRTLFNTIDEGFCIIEMLVDENSKPYDYRFVEYNPLFEEMTGLYGALGKTALEMVPDLEAFWITTYGKVALTGDPARFENSSERMQRWFSVYASRVGNEGSRKVAIVFTNITNRKIIERDRERFLALGSDLQAISCGDKSFSWVSSAWERVLGYTFPEMTTMNWRDFIHPDDIEITIDTAARNLSGKEVTGWENRYRHKNGSYRWFSWNSKPFLDEGCTYGVATDITERKLTEEALRQSEERYSTIIHQATAGVVEMDVNGRHIFVNKKWCETTGFSEEELMALTCFEYIHPDDVEPYQQLFQQTALTGQPFISEKRIICKDGTEVWINETLSGISDAQNAIKSIVSVCIDITDRKTIEKQKDEFIGVASHELKTPVTSLKAYAQILQMRFTQAGDLPSAGMMQKMEGQINRLTVLVQDLLDVTRLEGNQMKFRREVFDVSTMIANTIEEVQRTLPQHTIVCEPVPKAYVFADMERTSQVLVNFLTNATKYSPKADRIIVSASITGASITCAVQDFGIGIPAESHKYIFDRFYRVSDNSRNTYPGLGLGLYISSEIIKKQKGSIWFTSTVNEGSVFSFRLPLYHQS